MKNKTTFIRLVFLFCMGMFGYCFFIDDTHEMIFWGVLTLMEDQSLSDLKNNK